MATLSEKLLLTLDTKNGIKKVLEDNDISLTDKTFADYPTVIKDNLGRGCKSLFYSAGSSWAINYTNYAILYYPFKISLQLDSGVTEDKWTIIYNNQDEDVTKVLNIDETFTMTKDELNSEGCYIKGLHIGTNDFRGLNGLFTIESI